MTAEGAKLTNKADIKANTRAIKIEEGNLNYARQRSDELLAEYDRMLEEKALRDEEWAFQELIDSKWEASNAIWETINTW